MNKLHPFGHGGDIRTAAKYACVADTEIVDFSANINPYGPPPGLMDYLASALPQTIAYPDPACRRLNDAIINRYQPAGTVLAGNGAGELIYLLMRALPAGPVSLLAPTFTLYTRAAQAAKREISYHSLHQDNRFQPNIETLCAEISHSRPAVTFLCNPNNPTGTLMSRQDVLTVAHTCAEYGGYVVVDEAFLEFLPAWQDLTLLQSKEKNLIVLCSLTKMYAIPGLRLGFMSAPESVVTAVAKLRDPWSVNQLAQRAGEYVLANGEFARKTARNVTALASALAEQLREIQGLNVYWPAANYIFLESEKPSHLLQQQLLQRKILVRDCGNYQGLDQRFIRVAVRRENENNALLSALKEVLMTEDKRL